MSILAISCCASLSSAAAAASSEQPVASSSQQKRATRPSSSVGSPLSSRDGREGGAPGPRHSQRQSQPCPLLNEQALEGIVEWVRGMQILSRLTTRCYASTLALDVLTGSAGPPAITSKFLANLAAPRSLPGPLAALACGHAGLGKPWDWDGHPPAPAAAVLRPRPQPTHTRPSIHQILLRKYHRPALLPAPPTVPP